MEQFGEDRICGYEGTMVRNADSLYENKRSYNLQKIKEFDDGEFTIVGMNPGRGRMADCAIFTCANAAGDTFDCKMEGSLDVLKEILKNPKSVIGKMLTVRYQGFTNGKMPRFPIGVCVRDYE
jgi:DNA ligase-1